TPHASVPISPTCASVWAPRAQAAGLRRKCWPSREVRPRGPTKVDGGNGSQTRSNEGTGANGAVNAERAHTPLVHVRRGTAFRRPLENTRIWEYKPLSTGVWLVFPDSRVLSRA